LNANGQFFVVFFQVGNFSPHEYVNGIDRMETPGPMLGTRKFALSEHPVRIILVMRV
jgi:hypothetical protein